eukprot:TRINITY_DN115813_c0_g1_i1.p1 TRINITY_DN115813_c0_g1~~TRINITY_DN115813_c0_g1_i1.p1  ORF type:complete len:283 (-),score=129.72 TRINITY_DN115813_c0_g1_i1:75-875(-)
MSRCLLVLLMCVAAVATAAMPQIKEPYWDDENVGISVGAMLQTNEVAHQRQQRHEQRQEQQEQEQQRQQDQKSGSQVDHKSASSYHGDVGYMGGEFETRAPSSGLPEHFDQVVKNQTPPKRHLGPDFPRPSKRDVQVLVVGHSQEGDDEDVGGGSDESHMPLPPVQSTASASKSASSSSSKSKSGSGSGSKSSSKSSSPSLTESEEEEAEEAAEEEAADDLEKEDQQSDSEESGDEDEESGEEGQDENNAENEDEESGEESTLNFF